MADAPHNAALEILQRIVNSLDVHDDNSPNDIPNIAADIDTDIVRLMIDDDASYDMLHSDLVGRAHAIVQRLYDSAAREVPTPGWKLPAGVELQPGAEYRSTVSADDNKTPVLRRVAHWDSATRDHDRDREMKRLQKENGRLGNEIGKLRLEIEALRGRGLWKTIEPLASALGASKSSSVFVIIRQAAEIIRGVTAQSIDGDQPAGVNAVVFADAYAAESRRLVIQDAALAARAHHRAEPRVRQETDVIRVEPKEIAATSWLNEPRFEGFVRAYKYAASHFSLAAHAFAKVSPEEAHWIWRTVDKGMARNVRLDKEKERKEREELND